MSTNPQVDLIERAYVALDGDDIPAFLALFATDAEVHYPAEGRLPYGGTWRGHEGIARFLELHEETEEIVEFSPTDIATDAGTVHVTGFFRGRSRTSGRTWQTRWVHRFDVADGRIRHWEAFFDTAAAVAARQR